MQRCLNVRAHETGAGDFSRDSSKPIPTRDRTLPYPLSPLQKQLWFMGQLSSRERAYKGSDAVRITGKPDVEMFEAALNAIVARHKILCSTVKLIDGRPVVVAHQTWPWKLNVITLKNRPLRFREAELAQFLIDERRNLYDLEAALGRRATVTQLSAYEHVFIMMFHHLICDGLSVGILWRERFLISKDASP